MDIVAMVFGMPNALFPALAPHWGGPKALGWLYSAPAIGALVITLLSGWAKKVVHHGAAVILAAIGWGIGIIAFGFSKSLLWALFFLGIAGAADCISGIFRTTIWNETIPDRLRGRMAGLEMISYMTGPLMGNAEAGLVASVTSTQISIISGGVLCVLGVCVIVLLIPAFWHYRKINY